MDRLVARWLAGIESADQETFAALRTMRARSRDLFNNNPYAKAFAHHLRTNVIGHAGIRLRMMARRRNGELDAEDNRAVEREWMRFRKKGNFDVTGKLSAAEFERLLVETVAKDGEVLIRRVRGYPNEHGYALQFLESDLLDEDFNMDTFPPTGNSIRMSVEIDGWRRPVAYHLLANHPGDFTHQFGHDSRLRLRVPADEIIHEFIPLRPLSTRGIPWLHAAILNLRDLGGYNEAAIIAARVGAAKMGFFSSEDADTLLGSAITTDEDSSNPQAAEEQSSGPELMEAQPGSFQRLPPGAQFHEWDPAYPHEQFGPFNKAMLRGVAAAAGISYNSLANDLESTSFSSSRMGLMEERDVYKTLQGWLTESFHDRIFPAWLGIQLNITGRLRGPFEKLNAATWRGRRWASIDPLKDTQADERAVNMRFRSISDVIRDRGEDPESVFQEIADERRRLGELGVLPVENGSENPMEVTVEQQS